MQLLAQATEFTKDDRYTEAIPFLEELVKRKSDCHAFLAVLANAYRNTNRLADAEHYFRLAIQQRPDWEMSSLGLFHSLCAQSKYEEAIEEIKRFQSISYSSDYEEIVRTFNAKYGDNGSEQ